MDVVDQAKAVKNKENHADARKIRQIQQQNEENLCLTAEKENVPYFSNESFLRDYEIEEHLLAIFSMFMNESNECAPCVRQTNGVCICNVAVIMQESVRSVSRDYWTERI